MVAQQEPSVKAFAACSGIYDLEPVRLSARNNYLNLDEASAILNSPITIVGKNTPPALVAWGTDELPEFKRSVLETMRQPLEDGVVTISRAAGTMTFPSRFMLVAAMNPTPDGKMPAESRSSPREIQNYLGRISGPLLDRVDLHIEVPPVKFRDMSAEGSGESSASIRERAIAARSRQHDRYTKTRIPCNARMGSRELKAHCALADANKELLRQAMDELQLSARAYARILKVARTIADLDDADTIGTAHLSEAIQYRSLDRQIWG